MKKEQNLQIAVCTWLKYQYPELIFFSDASGIRTSIGVARQMKATRSGKSIPDLFIAEPNNIYHGLFLELKSESPYLKDGGLSKDKHIQEQNEMLKRLFCKGYYACFVWEFEQAKLIIEGHLFNSPVLYH